MPIADCHSKNGSLVTFPVLAVTALLVVSPIAGADCVPYCQGERYACEDSADSSACSTQFQICVQNCLGGGAGADNYGAIAYSPSSGEYGYSYEFETQGEAERRALAECASAGGEQCEIVVWFNQACGAIAKSDTGAWGADWGESRAEAEAKATAICDRYSDHRCGVLHSQCTN